MSGKYTQKIVCIFQMSVAPWCSTCFCVALCVAFCTGYIYIVHNIILYTSIKFILTPSLTICIDNRKSNTNYR